MKTIALSLRRQCRTTMPQSLGHVVLCSILIAAASTTYAAPPRIHTTADAPWNSGGYLYDGSGNIRSIGTDRYVYDAAGRLLSGTVRGPQHRQEYVYDAFGNRITSTTVPLAPCAGGVDCDESITVDPLTNRIISGAATYDEAGDVTSLGNGHSTYVYDAAGMLSGQTDGANVRQYVYTADDQRIAVYSNHEWLWSVRDPAQRVVREFSSHDGAAQWTANRDYVYSDSALLGTFSAAGRHHLHRDHLGTPRLITDDNARRLAEHDYYPFGAELQLIAENPEERMKFTGHERDTIAGEIHTLDYMHARYYTASMGRFLSVDPGKDWDAKQPQSWNMYAYVRNSPIGRTDPSGRAQTCGDHDCTTTADTYDPAHSTGQTTVATPEMRAAAIAEASKLELYVGKVEPMGYGVRDGKGNLTVVVLDTNLGNTTFGGRAATAKGQIPPHSAFAIHGHLQAGMVDEPTANQGYGDTQSLTLKKPVPNATVAHGHVGWHEIQNGQLTFTAPVGALTPEEQRKMQANLDKEQKEKAFWKE